MGSLSSLSLPVLSQPSSRGRVPSKSPSLTLSVSVSGLVRPRTRCSRVKAGGNHFRNLINSQGGRFDHPEHDEAEAALDAFWLKRGVKEQAYRSRLVDMGESERDLYRDPVSLGHSLDRLQVLFPGTNVAAMMWKEPAVLHLPLKHVAAQLVSLRWAMPSVDVRKIVEGQPGLLLRDVGEAAAAVAAIQSEFPAVNVSLVIETEPSILTLDCDVPGRLDRLARMKSRPGGLSPSLATFYEGGSGSANVILFAKVFLEETRGGGEAYESDTAWG